VLVGFVLAILLRSFLFEQFYVQGPSMEPTLHEPSRVVVEKVTGGARSVRRGDVVVFEYQTSEGRRDLIKRVIGVPGDLVEIRSCTVMVNSVPLDEPYVAQGPDCGTGDLAEMEVPDGEIFVMGDNRAHSSDSREFGTVRISRVVGRAVLVVWPPSQWRAL
jgi:signal peptidase I